MGGGGGGVGARKPLEWGCHRTFILYVCAFYIVVVVVVVVVVLIVSAAASALAFASGLFL